MNSNKKRKKEKPYISIFPFSLMIFFRRINMKVRIIGGPFSDEPNYSVQISDGQFPEEEIDGKKSVKYISEIIGDDYKYWMPVDEEIVPEDKKKLRNDLVLISTQTGSGKTHFILTVLLNYAQRVNKKILYLVNRKVLKKQLLDKIEPLSNELRNSICVETYQRLEDLIIEGARCDKSSIYRRGYQDGANTVISALNQCDEVVKKSLFCSANKLIEHKFSGYDGELKRLASFDIVVCDECQYFINESNYNRNTILSYNFIRNFYGDKLKIFLSATIDELKEYICDGKGIAYPKRTPWFGLNFDSWVKDSLGNMIFEYKPIEYKGTNNYDYINLHFFYNVKDIISEIKENRGKWLLFVDSKVTGKQILDKLKDSGKKTKDTGTVLGDDTNDELHDDEEKLEKEKKDEKRKISVSFVTSEYSKDKAANDEVDSIVQSEKQSADVLICTSVLDNGINISDKELRQVVIMADNKTEFLQMLGRRRKVGNTVDVHAYVYDVKHFRKRVNQNNRKKEIAQKYYDHLYDRVKRNTLLNEEGYYSNIFAIENDMNLTHGRYVLDHIFDKYDQIENTHLVYDGMFLVNPFALRNLQNQNRFYREMINTFENGEDYAFEKEVISWLNLDAGILDSAILTPYERAVKRICNAFDSFIGKEMSEKKCAECKHALKGEFRLVLKENKKSLDNVKYRTMMDVVDKKSRAMTKPFMEGMSEILKKPYVLQVQGGVYKISIDKDI